MPSSRLRLHLGASLGIASALFSCGKSAPSTSRSDEDGGAMSARDAGADAADGPSHADASAADAGEDLESCGALSASGRCASDMRVELCIIPSGGQVRPHRAEYACEVGEKCAESATGASCVASGECVNGTRECLDASTLRTCAAGRLQDDPCATGCVENALGAQCAYADATATFTGRLSYDARIPKTDYTDWSDAPTQQVAKHVMVVSYAGDEIVDATYTGEDGSFSLSVPSAPSSEDSLVMVLAAADPRGSFLYAVADPGFPPSTMARSTFETPVDPNTWAYRFALTGITDPNALRIPESAGSGAVHLYQTLDAVYRGSEAHFQPKTRETILVWMGLGTLWDCGACTAKYPTTLASTKFIHQVWFDGSSDEGYWSDAVTAHELGHVVMGMYGYEPAEGGPHFIGMPTNPGQAWSEGWATFFSAMQRASDLYYDKQGDSFFWFDLSARAYGFQGGSWQRPVAAGGLTQLIDENEVAALALGAYRAIGDDGPILDAIASARMTVPPFERGYTMRIWSDPKHPEAFTTNDQPLPYHADFFDALRCLGAIDAKALDAVTEPTTRYPYPSEAPLCR
jgi:hypothetical protein